jgi:hypothetical protein
VASYKNESELYVCTNLPKKALNTTKKKWMRFSTPHTPPHLKSMHHYPSPCQSDYLQCEPKTTMGSEHKQREAGEKSSKVQPNTPTMKDNNSMETFPSSGGR